MAGIYIWGSIPRRGIPLVERLKVLSLRRNIGKQIKSGFAGDSSPAHTTMWENFMPRKPITKICLSCRREFTGAGSLCPECKPKDTRPTSVERGYDREWRRVRREVLKEHGIPQWEWKLYDVDHNPPYDPSVQTDHRAYNLIPRLKADHSRKTATEDTRRDAKGRFAGKAVKN